MSLLLSSFFVTLILARSWGTFSRTCIKMCANSWDHVEVANNATCHIITLSRIDTAWLPRNSFRSRWNHFSWSLSFQPSAGHWLVLVAIDRLTRCLEAPSLYSIPALLNWNFYFFVSKERYIATHCVSNATRRSCHYFSFFTDQRRPFCL